MFEQFAQVLTLLDLSLFRFIFSGHYESCSIHTRPPSALEISLK